ncbi:MAG: hypothetical protein KGZ83_05215 [Sulfuricella sp.]|nr:hypothetical protein [Sulfuricella sp.]
MRKSKLHQLMLTVAYGLVSVALYWLLLANSGQLVEFANRTHQGEKMLFLVPIVIAFIFSYVHGTFTGHFWESLGIKAAKGSETKKKGS